jgi:hypothetical protein
MIEMFAASNLARVKIALGVLEADITAAIKTATRRTFKWAEREAAKQIAAEAGIPYRAARTRTRSKYRLTGSGQVWFGLNPVSAKYLGAKERKGGFTAPKLNQHFFRRRGRDRLPIDRVEKAIEDEGVGVVEGEFPREVQDRLIEEFFLALDKSKGRAAGTSQAIALA